ncbi:hypothetical protein ACMXYO_06385 [Neptuniibacter sp. QD37_6]|uniref:hypothetical protein n=1 Tax=Neptuniibacter sp. QD37_6 TaxID=3398210 RepID=UPI0039F624D9
MTNQISETLIIGAQDLRMQSAPDLPPMDHLLERDNWPPSQFDPNNPDCLTYGTCCWRGYIGSWEVIGSKLFLREVRGKYKLKQDKPLLAVWITDNLVYETEQGILMELVIEKGDVIAQQPYIDKTEELHEAGTSGFISGILSMISRLFRAS